MPLKRKATNEVQNREAKKPRSIDRDVENLVQKVKQNPESKEVQAICAKLIQNFAKKEEPKFLLDKNQMEDVVDALIMATERFAEEEHVLCNCAYAIGVFALGSEEYRNNLMAKNIEDYLIKAMEKHPGSAEVQTNCAYAIWQLASEKNHCDTMMAKNVAGFLIKATRQYPSSGDVKGYCTQAVKSLVKHNKYCNDHTPVADILDSIVQLDSHELQLISKLVGENNDDAITCPITLDIMQDPVIAEDGMTYERKAIERWLGCKDRKRTSPLTRARIDPNNLRPNTELCDDIEDRLRGVLIRQLHDISPEVVETVGNH